MANTPSQKIGKAVAKGLATALNPKNYTPENLGTAVSTAGKIMTAIPKNPNLATINTAQGSITVPKPQFKAPPLPKAPAPPRSPLENISRGVQEMGANAVSGFIEGTGNLINAAGQAADVMSPAGMAAKMTGVPGPAESVTRPIQAGTKELAKIPREVQAKLGLDNNSVSSAIGTILGDIAASTPATVAGGMVGRQVTANLPLVTKAVHPFLSYLTGAAAASPVNTAGIMGATKGRLPTSEEFATSEALDIGMASLSYGLKKIAGTVYRWAVNPQTASPRKIQGAAEQAAGMDLTGNRSKVVAKVDKLMPVVGDARDKLIDRYKGTFKKDTILQQLLTAADGLDDVDPDAAAQLRNIAGSFADAKDALSAREVMDWLERARKVVLSPLKTAAKRGVPLSSIVITPKMTAWGEVYDATHQLIDGISPDMAVLNNQFETLYAVKDAALSGMKAPIKGNLLNPVSFGGAIPSAMTRGAGAAVNFAEGLFPTGLPSAGVMGGLTRVAGDVARQSTLMNPDAHKGLTDATSNFLKYLTTPQQ